MSNKCSGVFIGGFLIGTAIGSLTGLFAPRKSSINGALLQKTVCSIPNVAEDLSTSMYLKAHKISHLLLLSWDNTLERVQEAIASGIIANHEAKIRLQQKNIENTIDPSTQSIKH